MLVSERLADAADLRRRLRGARRGLRQRQRHLGGSPSGTHAVGVDYVPALLEGGRERAAAEGLDVEFRARRRGGPARRGRGRSTRRSACSARCSRRTTSGSPRDGPGHPARRHGRARLVDPGRVHRRDVPRHRAATYPPPRVASPHALGTGAAPVGDLFGDWAATSGPGDERTYTFRFTSPEEFVAFFRRWYGPTLKAFEALDDRRPCLPGDRSRRPRAAVGPLPRRRKHRPPRHLPGDRPHAALTTGPLRGRHERRGEHDEAADQERPPSPRLRHSSSHGAAQTPWPLRAGRSGQVVRRVRQLHRVVGVAADEVAELVTEVGDDVIRRPLRLDVPAGLRLVLDRACTSRAAQVMYAGCCVVRSVHFV